MANVKILKCGPHNFALALTASEIYKFIFVYLQKVGHGLQFLQLDNSMANVKIYKSLVHTFALALTVSEI